MKKIERNILERSKNKKKGFSFIFFTIVIVMMTLELYITYASIYKRSHDFKNKTISNQEIPVAIFF